MFELRELASFDVDLVLEMQEVVYNSLDDKSIFQRSTPEFISYCLTGGGVGFGAFTSDGRLVAYRLAYFPRDRPFNLAAGVLPPSEFPYVTHMDTTAVLPEWRRHGLANRLNSAVLEALRKSPTRHLFATASPFNPNSVKALLNTGLRTVAIVEKFGGKTRLLFYRPFPGLWPEPPVQSGDRYIPLANVSELAAIMTGGGIGVAITEGPDGHRLQFRRDSNPFATLADRS